jgi:hypothetical protein
MISILQFFADILIDLNCFTVASFSHVSFVTLFHQLTGSSIEVRLHLLEVTTFAEQVLGSSSALIFEDLFTVEVCTFGSLHELVSVVLVSEFEMIKSVNQGFKFFFTLSNLSIQLVTISL